MTDYAISKKSKRSLWIPILVFITLAACASAGYSYWHSHQVAADDKAQQRVVPSPVFYALDTFTVNLGDADRVLYIGITLRLKDEATRSRLSEYLPEVRSRLLLLFSRQDAAVLATEEGKKNLIAEIKTTLSTPLVACLLYTNPHPGICDVCQSALGGLFPSGSFLPPRQRFFELFPHPLIFSYISFSSGLLWYFLIVIHGLTSSLDMPVSVIRVVHDALCHWPLLSLSMQVFLL